MDEELPTERNFNVATYPNAGRLDEIGRSENDRDLRIIWRYIEVEQYAKSERPERPTPSIARSVLVSVWEAPRTEFHREEIDGRKGLAFGSKRLLIPWSTEALYRLRLNNSVADLVLEHVTPIDALWQELTKLHIESDSFDEWATDAQGYLFENYALAVLTKEQAAAIDSVGLKTKGFPRHPFARYVEAGERIAKKAALGKTTVQFDVNNFCHPGFERALTVDPAAPS